MGVGKCSSRRCGVHGDGEDATSARPALAIFGPRRPGRAPSLLLVVLDKAAVDEHRRTGHVVGVGRREEGDDAGHVVDVAEAPERDVAEQVAQLRRIVQEARVDRRLDRARRDVVTVMPSGASSIARSRASIRRPPLLAQYGAKFGNGRSSCTELMLMTLPPAWPRIRWRTKDCVRKKTPLRFTFRTSS